MRRGRGYNWVLGGMPPAPPSTCPRTVAASNTNNPNPTPNAPKSTFKSQTPGDQGEEREVRGAGPLPDGDLVLLPLPQGKYARTPTRTRVRHSACLPAWHVVEPVNAIRTE